jgi:hypothetical protein
MREQHRVVSSGVAKNKTGGEEYKNTDRRDYDTGIIQYSMYRMYRHRIFSNLN